MIARYARRGSRPRRPARLGILLIALVLPFRSASAGDDELLRLTDSFVQCELDAALIPAASLAIVRDGKVLHIAGFGETWPGIPVDPDTPFFIGSHSKAMTALGVMTLAEEGRISTSARAVDAIPGFRPRSTAASSIRIEDLLTHTSGFGTRSGRTPLAYSRDSGLQDLLREASALRPEGVPGEAFRYSNWNRILLGAAIESVQGQDYPGFMRDRIFAPLGMTRTSALRAEAAP